MNKNESRLNRTKHGFISIKERDGTYSLISNNRFRNHLQLFMMSILLFISSLILTITNAILSLNDHDMMILMIFTSISCILSFFYFGVLSRTERFDDFLPWVFLATTYLITIPYLVLSSHEWEYTYWISIIPMLLITTLGLPIGGIGSILLVLITVLFLYPLHSVLPGYDKHMEGEWVYRMILLLTECQAILLGSGISLLNTIIIKRLAQLEQNFRIQATKDSLTGLSNQQAFTDFVNNIHNEFHDGDELDMMFIDVDNFKHINDNFGHIAGNEFLCAIAEVLKKEDHLLAARWGGDEFVILEKGLPREVFIAEAKALKNDVLAITNPNYPKAKISVSVGLAITKVDKDFNFDKVIQEADVQAHAAKDSGKNCVRIKSLE